MSTRAAYKTVDVWLVEGNPERVKYHYNENATAKYILAIREREKLPAISYLHGGFQLTRKNLRRVLLNLQADLPQYVAGVLVDKTVIDDD